MLTLRKYAFQLTAGLIAIVALLVLYIFWPERTNLDAFSSVNEQYDVEILRDVYGVPHIYGATDPDVAFGLAYAHSEDDFETMQQTLAAARGKLAYVYGAGAAANDFMVQLLRIEEVVADQYETELDAATRELVEAYADGVNYYAFQNPNDVLPGLFPVTGQDVIAGFVHKTPLFFGIDSVLGELFADERRREVSAPDAVSEGNPPQRSARLPMPERTAFGSNAIAVGPGRSANGETMLAVNSHQPWSGPVAWYEAHLVSETGMNVTGGVFPGAPVILHGHNEDLGWAFTVNSPDLVDVYVLEINPDNPDQYRFDGEWRDLEVRQAPITVRLFGRLRVTVEEEVLWSVYGPTVRRPHGTYAIRFASYGRIDLVQQWYRMNLAEDFDSWRTALAEGPMPMFNAGYADAAGNIYYVYNARLPLRTEGYDWELYLPGNTSDTLWTETLPFDELPQVLNPPAGFLQNANNTPYQTTVGAGNPNPDDFSLTFGIETHMSNRALRALELYGGDESITPAEFIEYKYDVCYAAESDVGLFLEHMATSSFPVPAMESARLYLLAWDRCNREFSFASTIMTFSLYYLDQVEGANVRFSAMTGNDFTADQAAEALEMALNHMNENFGTIAVRWGQANRLRRGSVDVPLVGGPDQLHAIYGQVEDDGVFRAFNGDSYILIVNWDADGQVTSQSIHQFGSATLDASSVHYADQAPIFARRQLKPVWFTEADVRANLSEAYRP